MARLYADNAVTVLAAGITSSDTMITVAAGTGDNFPVVDGSVGADYFVITLEDASGNREFVKVIHRLSGSDTLGSGTYPCVRGYDGTTARSWSAGDIVDLRWTASSATELSDRIDANASTLSSHVASTSTHGVSGDIVGTTDTQTITNKTISITGNTIIDDGAGSGLDADLLDGKESTDFSQLSAVETFTGHKTFTERSDTTYSLTGSGTINLDPANGHVQYTTITGPTTITESLTDGQTVRLVLTDAGTNITWPTGVVWLGGVEPPLQISGTDEVTLTKVGSTLYGASIRGGQADAIQYTPAGSGAAVTNVQDKLREIVSVKDFGVKGGGVIDETIAIQAAIDAVAVTGGKLLFPAGTYLHSGLTIKSGVILQGEGINATTLKLKDAANATSIQSENFATLTGSGKWLVSDGVPHGFGLVDLQIDGNKANQTTAGNGVEFFGKRIIVENVLIRDCYGVGWYSEAGDVSGQSSWEDLPESQIEGLWVRNCGSHGIQFRGPHDAVMEGIVSNENGGDGLLIQRSAGVYSGSCDIGFAHVYANSGIGIHADTGAVQFRGRQLISESNEQEGLVLAGEKCEILMLQLYNNCSVSGTYEGRVTGSQNFIRNLQVKVSTSRSSGSGIEVTGSSSDITGILIDGQGSSGKGLVASSGLYMNLQGRIFGFDGAGGIALETNSAGACNGSQFDFHLSGDSANAYTLWDNMNVGSRQIMRIRGVATGASATAFGGTAGPNSYDDTDTWDISLDENGVALLSSRTAQSSSFAADAPAGTTYTFAIAHKLILAPDPQDVALSVYVPGGSIGSFGADVTLESVDATYVNVKVRITNPAAAGKVGYVNMQVSL